MLTPLAPQIENEPMLWKPLLTFAAAVFATASTGPAAADQACRHAVQSEGSATTYWGPARMNANRSISLFFSIDWASGSNAHGARLFETGDPNYDAFLKHVGGLEPGEEKIVPDCFPLPANER